MDFLVNEILPSGEVLHLQKVHGRDSQPGAAGVGEQLCEAQKQQHDFSSAPVEAAENLQSGVPSMWQASPAPYEPSPFLPRPVAQAFGSLTPQSTRPDGKGKGRAKALSRTEMLARVRATKPVKVSHIVYPSLSFANARLIDRAA